MAIVADAPTGAETLGRTIFVGLSGEILEATIRTVMRAAGETPPADLLDEVAVFHAVGRQVPGGKAPKIAAIRACHDRLMADLEAANPRMVLSLGASACSSLSGTKKLTPISKWRGRMRWLPLTEWVEVPWVATISPGSVLARADLYRDLANDVWKAWTQRAPQDRPVVHTVVPRDFDALRGAMAVLEDATVVSCDVETTGFDAWRHELIAVGFGADYGGGEGYAVVVPRELLSDPRVQDLCWDAAYRLSRRTVLQNGKFDMQFLAEWLGEGPPEEAMLGDTLLLGSLLDERSRLDRVGGLGLKDQASFRYDAKDYSWDWERFYSDMAHDGTYPGRSCDDRCPHPHPDDQVRADWDGLHVYLGLDVYYTARLWFDLVDEAEREGGRLLEAHDAVMVPAAKALAMCELRGAPLDVEWLETFAAWLRRRIDRRRRVLESVILDIGSVNESINVASPAQVADLMYDDWGMTPDMRRRTKVGDGPDRSTDKEHIESAIRKYIDSPTSHLRRGARWLRTLLRWRTDTKALSTYSESLLEKADERGRVHASFWLHAGLEGGTSTGRLSSSKPNLQNIPAVDIVEGEYVERRTGKPTRWPTRRGFAPPEGWLWVEADYSQLELRVAAWLSGDERLRQVFIDGKDIHLEVAATMFSKDPSEITKPERYLAKAVDFGILYGRQGKAISEGVEMDFLERKLGGKRWDAATADAFIAKFLRGYPQLGAWLDENGATSVRQGYVESPFGRRRRFPFAPRTRYEKMRVERQANNTPIQSAASDLCLMAMARIARRLPEGANVLFPVHDSICLEVREDLIAGVTAILREEMEIEVGGVPLTVDVEVGASWADAH